MGLLSGKRPDTLGVRDGRLASCPESPNCVSSDASQAGHRVEPFELLDDAAGGFEAARDALLATPGTTLVSETADYLHVECASRVLGFVDDLELHLRADAGIIAVRSASRLGYSDLGANRRRVEALRSVLRIEGWVK
jgi:uncharacterized protein (DUF1499 family)